MHHRPRWLGKLLGGFGTGKRHCNIGTGWFAHCSTQDSRLLPELTQTSTQLFPIVIPGAIHGAMAFAIGDK